MSNIFESVDQYISNLFQDESNDLKAAEQSIIDSGIPQISISPNQGKFLHVLAKLVNAKKILEIGTLGGYSTIWMAKALPANGRLITLEYEQKHANVAQKNITHAGLDTLIEIRLGKAIE